MESHLSIDEVAKRTGLTAYTLRYYERIGLIAPVARDIEAMRLSALALQEKIAHYHRLEQSQAPHSPSDNEGNADEHAQPTLRARPRKTA
jgi:hypothetical protein